MSRITIYLILTCIALVFTSCDLGKDNNGSVPVAVTAPKTDIKTEQKGRFAWQKPSIVIDKLGDLSGKTVADIGAGTGYFTFRFAQNAEKVIAIDIDPDMLEMIEVFRENLDSTIQQRIETRLSTSDDSKLWPEEADVAVIINTIGYIGNRVTYLRELRRRIKSDGLLLIVDFKLKRIPEEFAPPPESRVNIIELEEILMASGYEMVETDDTSLDYQYIILARRL